MFLDLIGKFRNVQLSSGFGIEFRTIVEVVEEVLVGIRARRSVLGESLKNAQIPICRGSIV